MMRKYSFQMLSAIFMLMWQASCGPKQSSGYAVQDAIYKTDSAANADPAYKNTTNAIALYEAQIQKYKDANKNMLRYYAQEYIERHVKDAHLRKILLFTMDEQILMEVSGLDIEGSLCDLTDVDSCYVNQARFFRRNRPWYNALINYLLDNYDEKQLLNSGLFEILQNPGLTRSFRYNADQIAQLTAVANIASQRANTIYDELWKGRQKD